MTEEEWKCPDCGSTDPHHAIEVMDSEIEVDVTCNGVYFTFIDNSGDPGMFFTYEEFEEIMEHYRDRPDYST